jgi:hypothetical protein
VTGVYTAIAIPRPLATLLALGLLCGAPIRAQVLVVDAANSPVRLPDGGAFEGVTVEADGVLETGGTVLVSGDLVIRNRGRLTLPAGVPALALEVGGVFEVEPTGSVDLDGMGPRDGTTVNPATGAFVPMRYNGANGGSHCGLGAGSVDGRYDAPLAPRWPGSAGGKGGGGTTYSAGGGALLVKARRAVLDGTLRANGEWAHHQWNGGAAGGTINVEAEQIEGGGRLEARGGGGGNSGGGGCIRLAASSATFIGTFDVSEPTSTPAFPDAVGVAVSVNRATQAVRVERGALVLTGGERLEQLTVGPGAKVRLLGAPEVRSTLSVASGGTLVIENARGLERVSLAPLIEGSLVINTDVASAVGFALSGTMLLDRQLTAPSLELRRGAVLTHSPGGRTLHLVVSGLLTVADGARIDATGKGLGEQRTVEPVGLTEVSGSRLGNGGSHGGAGGLFSDAGTLAPVFDDPEHPSLPGGGGGRNRGDSIGNAGSGGGVIRISAGALQVDGAVLADGSGSTNIIGGSGAGGSIAIRAGTFSGAGVIAARGPQARDAAQGGGGGGLVIVEYGASSFAGLISVAGGLGAVDGAPGVVTERSVPMVPTILSVPPKRVRLGASYGYAPVAAGTGPITWTLASGPQSARLDGVTGSVSWEPTSIAAAGFELVASNAQGADTQTFEVQVVEGSDSTGGDSGPRFISTPSSTAHCGVPYRYAATAAPHVSGEGPWTFELRAALGLELPSGLSIDPSTGALDWTPTAPEGGNHVFELRAVSAEGVARQLVAVRVECPTRLAVGCGCFVADARGGPGDEGSHAAAPGAGAAALVELCALVWLGTLRLRKNKPRKLARRPVTGRRGGTDREGRGADRSRRRDSRGDKARPVRAPFSLALVGVERGD